MSEACTLAGSPESPPQVLKAALLLSAEGFPRLSPDTVTPLLASDQLSFCGYLSIVCPSMEGVYK